MGSKANEIKMAYANVNKLTMHDTQVTYFRKIRLDFITTIIFMKVIAELRILTILSKMIRKD